MEKLIPIPNYNGMYLISEEGNVFTIRRQGSAGGALKQRVKPNGYYVVDLRNNGKRSRQYVYRLVAEAFIPNPEHKKCVNHRDGNKANNHVSNLEWCTHSENMKHASEHGLSRVPCFRGEKHPMAKLQYKDVCEIREQNRNGVTPSQLAKTFHVTREAIYNILNGKAWKEAS